MAVSLFGCSSTKTPVVKYTPNNSLSFLPAHADKQAPLLATQLAYLDRGLTLDRQGRLMPANAADCGVDIYLDIRGITTIEQLTVLYSPLYSGLSFNVLMNNGQLYIDASKPYSGVLAKQLLTWTEFSFALNKADAYVIDLSANQQLDDVLQAKIFLEKNLKARAIIFKVLPHHVNKIPVNITDNQQAIAVVTAEAGLNQPYAKVLENVVDNISVIHYSAESYSNDYSEKATGVEVNDNLLLSCRRFAHFISDPISSKGKFNQSDSTEDLIGLLPQDADFVDLSQQRQQLKQGRYITLNGDRKLLSQAKKSTKSTFSRCDGIDVNHEDYQLCRKSEYKEMEHKSRTVVIGGKG
ncbi:hypothetical protein ACWXWU_00565 [Shewanella sp. A14]